MTAKRRIPTMEEREQVALELGLIEPGQRLSPRLQRKTALLIQQAETDQIRDEIAARHDPAARAREVLDSLLDQEIPNELAAQLVVAWAREIWHDSKEAAQ